MGEDGREWRTRDARLGGVPVLHPERESFEGEEVEVGGLEVTRAAGYSKLSGNDVYYTACS